MMFQSAPPCGERHKGCRQEGACKGRFNPRPPAESDRYQSLSRPSTNGFNPRPPAESDHRFRNLGIVRLVSIRAPLRRATRDTLQELYTVLFQSAPPCGERPRNPAGPSRSRGFNPRPPAESDVEQAGGVLHFRRFNPRPPAESDVADQPAQRLAAVSIRAPLRRATSGLGHAAARLAVSIRAPLRRATRVRRSPASGIEFQSAPPCGERRDIREGGCG